MEKLVAWKIMYFCVCLDLHIPRISIGPQCPMMIADPWVVAVFCCQPPFFPHGSWFWLPVVIEHQALDGSVGEKTERSHMGMSWQIHPDALTLQVEKYKVNDEQFLQTMLNRRVSKLSRICRLTVQDYLTFAEANRGTTCFLFLVL